MYAAGQNSRGCRPPIGLSTVFFQPVQPVAFFGTVLPNQPEIAADDDKIFAGQLQLHGKIACGKLLNVTAAVYISGHKNQRNPVLSGQYLSNFVLKIKLRPKLPAPAAPRRHRAVHRLLRRRWKPRVLRRHAWDFRVIDYRQCAAQSPQFSGSSFQTVNRSGLLYVENVVPDSNAGFSGSAV